MVIEEAVLQILREQGYQALTFQNVAEAAGVARSTLHRRWSSRAAMAVGVMRDTARQNIVFEDTGSFAGDLRIVLLRIGRFIASPVGSAMMVATLEMQQTGEIETDAGFRWSERYSDVLPLFERAKARGEIGEHVDPEAAFALLSGALYFRFIVMGSRPDKAWIERTIASLMAGVQVRTKSKTVALSR